MFKDSILKLDSPSNVVAADSCNHTDQVCHGHENAPHDFFSVYIYLFNDLHVTLPFDEFIMEVLRILNVAPTQLHQKFISGPPGLGVAIQAAPSCIGLPRV